MIHTAAILATAAHQIGLKFLTKEEVTMPHKGNNTNYKSKPGHKKPVKKSTKKK